LGSQRLDSGIKGVVSGDTETAVQLGHVHGFVFGLHLLLCLLHGNLSVGLTSCVRLSESIAARCSIVLWTVSSLSRAILVHLRAVSDK
jgi:hypothetical protein